MNLYIRFFDSEILVTSLQQALDFIQSFPEIDADEFLLKDLAQYIESNNLRPRRFNTGARSYFIVIKTTAATMEEFKLRGAQANEAAENRAQQPSVSTYDVYRPGWYECRITFKRVVPIPQTAKFQYIDTTFVARVKAESVTDSYNRIIDHLRSRADIDPRCQFPSIKGKNFDYVYQGLQ